MSVRPMARQSAGILSASPHISCGFKHHVSEEIRERNCQEMTKPRSPQSVQTARYIKMHGTEKERVDISLK